MTAPSYDTWDFANLWPGGVDAWLMSVSYESGRNMLGISYAANYDAGGVWSAAYRDIDIFSVASHRSWIATAAKMNGGVTGMNILIPARRYNPFPANAPDQPTIDHSPNYILAQAGDSAALYSSTIKVLMVTGTALLPGHRFSVNHNTLGWRMYDIISVGSSASHPLTDSTAATLYSDVVIRPPLREAVTQGDVFQFDWPRIVMRLALKENMMWSADDWWAAKKSVRFVEYFAPR